MSLLDAATNDLAQLINRLDLEATPGSVEMTPISQRSPFVPDPAANSPPNVRLTTESPVKAPRRKNSSMTSLRPYAQSSSKNTGVQLWQNIAPWSTLNAGISPSKPSPSTIKINVQDNMATLRTHRRTMTPAPAADPSPVFKALRPATTRLMSKTVVGASSGISPFIVNPVDRSTSSLTFGSGHSTSESRGSLSASPVFKKAHGSTRKKSSLVPRAELDSGSLPILPEVRCALGLAGTVGSIPQQVYDGSDPNSDIPDEFQVILSNSDQEGEDTISLDRRSARPPLPSPGLPPETPLPVLDTASTRSSLAELPVFRATVIDEDEHHADVEEAGTLSEDDTKRSFDFTGELQKLNESGASDRRSFIEQLDNAFRTPAKIDLRYDFEDLPPVPKLPTLQDELSRAGEHSFSLPIDYESRELLPSGFPIDVNAEPSLLPGSDCFATTASDEELLDVVAPQVLRNATTVASQPSNGQLNRDFKFGGKHSSSSKKEASPLTLSDIIPPPEVVRSLSMVSFAGDESSLMKSILAHAIQIESPPERPRLDSNSPSKREAREAARKSFVVASHQRNSSALSFAGFDSFAEIRRGFEFHDSRPGFYPLPATMSAGQQRKHESIQSIASVSSYGNVLHGGSADPFDYGSLARLPSLRERPSSDNFSFTMSTSVDDTFSFIRRPPPRCRVDSDASSFYFRTSLVHPYNRSNRRPESGVSVGPRISLFNRNSTCHRRGDSNTSIISTAQSYANCRRFSWTRHRSNFSIESVVSDFTGTHLERPGLGDKMLESAQERVSPLASISASPPLSLAGSTLGERICLEDCDNRASYDSIMDSQYESQKTDSLFEKTGHRNSVCSSDSTFFEEHPGNDAVKLPRYRPISSISIPSVHRPPNEVNGLRHGPSMHKS
jgi:serine/arginine repetitive matrix protein 2